MTLYKSIDPEELVIIATIIGVVLAKHIDKTDIIILGNFVSTIIDTMFSIVAQEAAFKQQEQQEQ